MVNLDYKYIISPEVILNKYKDVDFTYDPYIVTGISKSCCSSNEISAETKMMSATTRIHLQMRDILSGGTGGQSRLTNLTIPILLTQSMIDIGFYTPFDGNILQKEVIRNFLFSADSTDPYKFSVYNTSDFQYKKYLNQAEWIVDWGDGITAKTTDYAPNSISHTYPKDKKETYVIQLTQKSPWGMYTVEKEVYVPNTLVIAQDPKGTVNFFPQGGIWDDFRQSQDYIFTGDSNNKILPQISSSYSFKQNPFIITGYSKSRLNELSTYGPQKYVKNKRIYRTLSGETKIINNKEMVIPVKQEIGYVIDITPTETKYVIDDITYIDYPDKQTIYITESSGITKDMISSSAITKDETLIRIVDKAQVWSDVFIERGKNSVFERVQRLGEVDNLGDIQKYGYGFFNVK